MGTSSRIAAVILAGGLGTRLRSVLPDLPKPMAPVAGRPFLEWVVDYLAAQGVQDVVISTGYMAEVFQQHFAAQNRSGSSTVRCVAEPEPLGTAGGFLFAAETSGLKPDHWLVLNGDSLALAHLDSLLSVPDDAAIVALWMNDAHRYGSVECGPTERLMSFQEKKPGSSWINAGIYLFKNGLLETFPRRRPLSFEQHVFPKLIEDGRSIRVVRVTAPFLDIGLPETLSLADGFISQNLASFGGDESF